MRAFMMRFIVWVVRRAAACWKKQWIWVKAVETGADIANKVAEEADKVAGKVKG